MAGPTGGAGRRSSLDDVVITLIRDARKRAGSHALLAARLEPYVGRRFSVPSVSNWTRGTREPSASVAFAAALATGISIDWYLDRYLGQSDAPMVRQPPPPTETDTERRLAAVEARLDELTGPLAEDRRRRRGASSANETKARKSG